MAAFTSMNINASALVANKPLLDSILEFHIVSGVIPTKAATRTGIVLSTLLPGQTLKFYKK